MARIRQNTVIRAILDSQVFDSLLRLFQMPKQNTNFHKKMVRIRQNTVICTIFTSQAFSLICQIKVCASYPRWKMPISTLDIC